MEEWEEWEGFPIIPIAPKTSPEGVEFPARHG